MLTAADEGIGNLTTALKETGLWENTLIIVTTDNDGPTTVGCVQGSSNYPKRGGKCSLWEGGTTGDALLSGPALDNLLTMSKSTSTTSSTTPSAAAAAAVSVGIGVGGSRNRDSGSNDGGSLSAASTSSSEDHVVAPHRRRIFRHLFHVVDWFPTLAEWVGVVPLNQTNLDGISQVDALAGNNDGLPARTELFGGYAQCEDNFPTQYSNWWGPAIRHLNWKLVQGESAGADANTRWPPGSHIIQPPGDNATSKYLLFDLEKDPREEHDLSELYPDVLQKMIYKLKLYRKSFVYPQINDDSNCPFTGLVNTTAVGPAWCVWIYNY